MNGLFEYQVSKDNAGLKVYMCMFGVELYYDKENSYLV